MERTMRKGIGAAVVIILACVIICAGWFAAASREDEHVTVTAVSVDSIAEKFHNDDGYFLTVALGDELVKEYNLSYNRVSVRTRQGIYDRVSLGEFRYLLLKHYDTSSRAYEDFLKLVGKMCRKSEDSKYFQNRLSEDNRMVRTAEGEHGITREERAAYEGRFAAFREFAAGERDVILKAFEG